MLSCAAVDGEVYACGANENGQLSFKGTDNVTVPQRVHVLDTCPIVSITAGSNFSMAVTHSQRAVSWGGGEFGQLGNGPAVAFQVCRLHIACV